MNGLAPLHRDPRVVEAADAALAQLAERCPTLRIAMIATDDGFEVTRVESALGAPDDDRLASMASTLIALGDATIRALALGGTSHVAIAGTRGSVLVRRVGDHPLTLVAVFAPATDVDGKAARMVAAGLAAALAPEAEPALRRA
ncbi:roadblock/LC7 domain-containing protein [Homoserinibacter sp. GY 40078]|uniref:roadblock/LC7 domain-containing protein n=1 Tax=Homoserinibacter sp. GY 40078 TaxID=2603275 RepID=UPI0011CCD02D|nr:roadblock/LC7 domain-containing protein [Homoserinibacter sp. GY 40078]TXK19660.1 roadblock/LC7 domain-containing protein [Homoserinibacter sp. GY 40078]